MSGSQELPLFRGAAVEGEPFPGSSSLPLLPPERHLVLVPLLFQGPTFQSWGTEETVECVGLTGCPLGSCLRGKEGNMVCELWVHRATLLSCGQGKNAFAQQNLGKAPWLW